MPIHVATPISVFGQEEFHTLDHRIMGVMIESYLEEGRQDLKEGVELLYGQSVTDACLGWSDSVPVLRQLADAVRERRKTA